jgi:hypothetical protein
VPKKLAKVLSHQSKCWNVGDRAAKAPSANRCKLLLSRLNRSPLETITDGLHTCVLKKPELLVELLGIGNKCTTACILCDSGATREHSGQKT